MANATGNPPTLCATSAAASASRSSARSTEVRRAQAHQALMVGHLTPFDPVYVESLAGGDQVDEAGRRWLRCRRTASSTTRCSGPVFAMGLRRELPDVRLGLLAAARLPLQTGEARPAGRGEISLSGIVYSRSVRMAGNQMDEAITNYLKRKQKSARLASVPPSRSRSRSDRRSRWTSR